MTSPNDSENQKAFISYSWTNAEVVKRVHTLADRLVNEGFDVALDVYDLRPGDDRYKFMERSVNDPNINKVIAMCDKSYALKVDGREGGVGDEATIIAPSVYKQAKSSGSHKNRFVAVVFDKDDEGNFIVPAMFGSLLHIDFTNPDLDESKYFEILGFLKDEPQKLKPPLGKRSQWLSAPSLITDSQSKALNLIYFLKNSNNKRAERSWREYLEAFLGSITSPLATDGSRILDEKFIAIIKDKKPLLEEYSEVLQALVDYAEFDFIQIFLLNCNLVAERILEESNNGKSKDVMRLLMNLILTITMASLLKYRKYEMARRILITPATFKEKYHFISVSLFYNFRIKYLDDIRNEEYSNLMHENLDIKNLNVEDVVQADIILFINSVLRREDYKPFSTGDWLSYPSRILAESIGKEAQKELDYLFDITGVKRILESQLQDVDSKLRSRLDRYFPSHENWVRFFNL